MARATLAASAWWRPAKLSGRSAARSSASRLATVGGLLWGAWRSQDSPRWVERRLALGGSCHAPTVEHVLAVDIGGTKLAAGVVDAEGRVLVREQVPTRGHGADDLFATLAALVDAVRGESGGTLVGCGVGCGGPMRAGGEAVSPLNIPAWRDFPLRSRLAEHVGLPTWVDNDAKALALGEGWRGAAAGHRNYLAMVVSTGVGGGIVLDGRLLDGAGGNAGHIGHVNVVPDGRPCVCGAHGCLEAEASGTAIAAVTGMSPREASLEVRRRTGTLVGRAVGSIASLLDLQLA
ncbi:MAG: ROK family protein, partial [Actinobacteria bacterium]|nr:ROK family protein [Actinomycetota bacterium]